jgi:hypothetical protein
VARGRPRSPTASAAPAGTKEPRTAPWTPGQRDPIAADPALRAFVVDPSRRFYGGWPDSATLAWLSAHAREVTDSIATTRGRALGVRVFVR